MDQNILFEKLSKNGINGIENKWFQIYFDKTSIEKAVRSEVPQGFRTCSINFCVVCK